MWNALRWQARSAQAGIYNIEITYPTGQTRLLTGCEGPPVIGTEIEPRWFVTGVTARRGFVAGYPVDYEVAVAERPPERDRDATVGS
jgi:hypothetical protein